MGTVCSGRGTTLATDPANCGMCGRACTGTPPPNSVVSCRASTCGFACAAGFGDCDGNTANGRERDVSADRGGATIGVQGNSAAEFAQFSCNTDAITSNSQIRLTPQP